MAHEIISQVHEITQHVNLTGDHPIMTTDRGLKFFPRHIAIYWIRENAGAWELMSTTIKGKLRTPTGAIGTRDGSRSYWASARDLPGWVGEIVEQNTPVEVLQFRGEA